MSGSHGELPPSYQAATSTGGSTKPHNPSSHLEVPPSYNGVPAAARRSMEDESRSLPSGWIRQYDPTNHHQFFVDTKADPPRSIWHHPYDDETYLKSLSSEERERIQAEEHDLKRPITPGSVDEKVPASSPSNAAYPTELPPRPHDDRKTSVASSSGKQGIGSKLKDKITGMTKEERAADKARRAEEERQIYEAHMRYRQAMSRAQQTGEPQLIGQDKQGRDVYIEPPPMYGGYGPYGGRGYGVSPYQSGVYANPNARFIRPGGTYGRPYGPGYGGGMGLPIMGGLMGGALLGGLLF